MRFFPIVMMLTLIMLVATGCEQPVNQDPEDQRPPTTTEPVNNQRNYTIVESGDTITAEYTGRLENGTIFDSSEFHNESLTFQVGAGQMIPGFDQGVIGMTLDEEGTIIIPAAQAYGEERQELVQNVPKDRFPANTTFEVGMQVAVQTAGGQQLPARIVGVSEDEITINANHPLAGETLNFTVTVTDIR